MIPHLHTFYIFLYDFNLFVAFWGSRPRSRDQHHILCKLLGISFLHDFHIVWTTLFSSLSIRTIFTIGCEALIHHPLDPRSWTLEPASWIDNTELVRRCGGNKPDNIWSNLTMWLWRESLQRHTKLLYCDSSRKVKWWRQSFPMKVALLLQPQMRPWQWPPHVTFLSRRICCE